MDRKKAVTLTVVLIVILSVFVILASLGGAKVLSPIPEEPKIIWIKPSLTPAPTSLASPSATASSKPKVVPTVKPTINPTAKPTTVVSPSPTATP